MADTLTPVQRHSVMSKNRSRGARSTERALRARLAAARLQGWRMHPTTVIGRPDFIFPRAGLAIFVDGCFWHKCPKHKNLPTTNREFWSDKIARNMARDKEVNRTLRRLGWRVLRIWEHDLKERPETVVPRIRAALAERRSTHARLWPPDA